MAASTKNFNQTFLIYIILVWIMLEEK